MIKNSTALIKVINPETAKIKQLRFVTSGYTLFFNAQHQLAKLSTKERCFLEYLCEYMRTSTNDITIDSRQKENFIKHYQVYTSKTITISAVNKFMSKLKLLGLILETPYRGFYIVNPKYFFKGANNSRLKYLKVLIENRLAEGLSVASLINAPENEFKS
jgi:hypothetical protein